MIPHERSLVEAYKDEPFALVGINTDSSKEVYAKKAQEMKVTWRSAWTGGKKNPISEKFKIEGYPTLYLIDHEGVIRKKWLGAPGRTELEKAIEELVAKAGK
jgi:hypothetical protein